MNNMKAMLAVLVVVLVLSYSLGMLLENDEKRADIEFVSDCDLVNETCHIKERSVEYEVGFDGEPSPLKPFGINLRSLNNQPINVVVTFEMEGMDMGYNAFPLANDGANWNSKVLLPVCSLGRNDWIMRLTYSTKMMNHLTVFRFTQISQ